MLAETKRIHGRLVAHVNMPDTLDGVPPVHEQYNQLSVDRLNIELPIDATPRRIIGYGKNSVAVRFEDTCGGTFVCVIPTREGRNHSIEQIRKIWAENHRLAQGLAGIMIDQHLIIAPTERGAITGLKFAQEVDGGTIKDLRAMYLLANPTALLGFVRVCERVLENMQKTGQLADIFGSVDKAESFNPFTTGNLMIAYHDSSVVSVDNGAVKTLNFHKTDLPHKGTALARAGAVAAAKVVAEAFLRGHCLQAKLAKSETIQAHERHDSPHYQAFLRGMNFVVRSLETMDINYRVVGSVAIAAHMQSAGVDYFVSPFRGNGTSRDIDILILETDPKKLEIVAQLRKQFKSIRESQPGFPDVELATIDGTGVDRPKTPFIPIPYPTETSITCKNGAWGDSIEELFIPYNGDEEAITAVYDGVEIQTVSPDFIAALCLIRNGAFKFKDFQKLLLFFEKTGCSIAPRYRDFAQDMRQNYPDNYRAFLIRQWIHYLTLDRATLLGKAMRKLTRRSK